MEVNIRKIQPGIFASFYGYGKQPEEAAMDKLLKWCKRKNIFLEDKCNVIFGFNNPNPDPEYPDYGYELWFKVERNERPDADTRLVEFNGGSYAVAGCTGAQGMMQCWMGLYQWCRENNYKLGYHQPLEKIVEDILDIDKIKIELYCPVILESGGI